MAKLYCYCVLEWEEGGVGGGGVGGGSGGIQARKETLVWFPPFQTEKRIFLGIEIAQPGVFMK